MKHKLWIGLAALAALTVGSFAWHMNNNKITVAAEEAKSASEETAPIAKVAVTVLRNETIVQTITSYGTVVAAPGEAHSYSIPFECRIRKVFVTGGQVVAANTPLLEIEPSADTLLQYDQARSERTSAAQALQLVEQRLELKLATRPDLLQAKQRLHDAEARVQSLEKRGVGTSQLIRADSNGVVSQATGQPGQTVPAGSPLIETIGTNQLVVRLGVESTDVPYLKRGQEVRLSPVDAPTTRTAVGQVRLITRQVNPQTRLVDVFVAPASAAQLLLNEYVRAGIAIAAHSTLVAPRAAVFPGEGQYVLFTVEKGHAVKHVVKLGVENPRNVQVISKTLRAGARVVIVGNSELTDGMAVEVEKNP